VQINRKLSEQEAKLLEALASKASINLPVDWQETIMVSSMDDGKMGSLYLFPKGIIGYSRLFGRQASDCCFIDKDGIKVIASLNLDNNGDLFELDIWKTDYSPLIYIPDNFDDI